MFSSPKIEPHTREAEEDDPAEERCGEHAAGGARVHATIFGSRVRRLTQRHFGAVRIVLGERQKDLVRARAGLLVLHGALERQVGRMRRGDPVFERLQNEPSEKMVIAVKDDALRCLRHAALRGRETPLYRTMEYLHGENLSARIARRPLALGKALHVALQICDALGASHSPGIVHRDIKPANIFLLPRGGDDNFVKVLDFGLARMPPTLKAYATAVDEVFGSPPT